MTDSEIKKQIIHPALKDAGFDINRHNVELVWHHTMTPLSDHQDEWELAVEDAMALVCHWFPTLRNRQV